MSDPFTTSLDGLKASRLQLLANGYEPIPICGKAPHWKGWAEGEITDARLAEIEAAHPDHSNTGIRTGLCAAIDIDLTEAAHVAQIEEIVVSVLGWSPLRRIGSKGCLLCYYNPTPIAKITIGSKKKRLVEFLGTGQQFAAYGEHPDTGKPYDWPNNFFGGDPLQTPLTELPHASPEMLREAARRIAAKLIELGYGDVKVSEAGVSASCAPSPATGRPVSAGIVEAMLRCVSPSVDRNEWLIVCGALCNAPVNDANWDGLDLFTRWSGGELHGGDAPTNFQGDDDCEREWSRDQQKRANGEEVPAFGALVNLARENGYEGPSDSVSPAEMFKGALEKLNAEDAADQVAKQETPRDSAGTKLLPSYMGGEIGKITPPRWLIKGVIPTPAVGIYFGKFGTFKTTTEIDSGDSVLTGTKAFGHFDAEQGDVVLVAGEGLSGLKNRIEARARKHGLTLDQYPLLLVTKVPKADRPEEWAALAETIKARGLKPKFIGIDHLSIMLSGQDQNDAAVATQAMQMAHELAVLFQCTVVILAHAGKEGDREVRGSSAFLDNVDFAYELTRTDGGDIVKVRCAKMRDGEAPEPFYLKAESRHGAAIMAYADKDDARRASGKQVGVRAPDVSSALAAIGACPGGANEWTGTAGGIHTRLLATEIAKARIAADGDMREPSPKEIDAVVMSLNRGAQEGGPFDAYVVRSNPRQWAIAPGPISGEARHV